MSFLEVQSRRIPEFEHQGREENEEPIYTDTIVRGIVGAQFVIRGLAIRTDMEIRITIKSRIRGVIYSK